MMRNNTMGIRGVCQAEVKGAYPETLLNACAMSGIEIWNMDCVDSFTLRFYIYEGQAGELRVLAEKSMCDLDIKTVSGGSRLLDFVKRHIGLALGLLFAVIMLSISSLFIWSIEVVGNENLSSGEIKRALASCGVDVGTFWPSVDKELLRSEMLLQLPELAWMTVNTGSSRAEVLVSERQEKPEIYIESDAADLIAAKTGIIKRISALNGKVVKEEGSAVAEGETIISGAMDSITALPRYVRSQGDVIAETWYDIHAVSPEEQTKKTAFRRSRTRFALKLGQRRLNFYFGGRKTVDGCDKIIDNYIIGIEGIFSLPATLIVERLIPYESEKQSINDSKNMGQRLLTALENDVDGEVLSSSLGGGIKDGLCYASLRAACLENIAQLSEYKSLEDNLP